MPLDPCPLDAVTRGGGDKLLPEFGILDWFLVGGAPAIALPAMHPLRDPVLHIRSVGGERHMTGTIECPKSPDCRQQLHAVVGRMCFAARKLLLVLARADDDAPTAGTGIALAGAVRRHLDLGKFAHAAA